MRARMKVCVALALTLLANVAALADVRVTGDANLRMGAGLEYDVFDSVPEGSELPYLHQVMTDERGVDWYMVYYLNSPLWISSKYAEVDDGDEVFEYDPEAAKSYIDVSQFYQEPLEDAAKALGLPNYREVDWESPYHYYDDALTIGGSDCVDYMELLGPGYTIFGAAIGMDIEDAKAALSDAGLTLTDESWTDVTFEHPANERSFYNSEGFDSCINLTCADGIVVVINWSSYTG